MSLALVIGLAAGSRSFGAADPPKAPTIDDLLNLKTIVGNQISPDGQAVAYGVAEADFEHDAFVTNIWIAREGAPPFQLTRGQKSASGFRWSPDSRWLAFLSSRVGDKAQIFAIRPDGGEAIQLTNIESDVTSLEWSPDGTRIAFTAAEPETKEQKDRKERLGDYAVVRREYSFVHLYTLDVAAATRAPVAGTAHTSGHDYSVGDFDWSPDGTRLAFSGTVNPDLVQGVTSDVYVLNLKTDKTTRIVSQAGPDSRRSGRQMARASPSSRRWDAPTSSTRTPASPSLPLRAGLSLRSRMASTRTRTSSRGLAIASGSRPSRRRRGISSRSTSRARRSPAPARQTR